MEPTTNATPLPSVEETQVSFASAVEDSQPNYFSNMEEEAQGTAKISGQGLSASTKSRTALLAAFTDQSPVDKERVSGAIAEREAAEGSYLNSLLATKRTHQDTIDLLGDSEIRRDRALKERQAELNDLLQLSRDAEQDEDLRQGALLAAQDAAAQDLGHKDRYALELQAVEGAATHAEFSDPHTRALIVKGLEGGADTIEGTRELRAQKSLLIRNFVDDLDAKAEDRGNVDKVLKFLTSELVFGITNGFSATGFGDDIIKDKLGEDGAGFFSRSFFPGRSQKQLSRAVDELSLPELSQFLQDFKGDLEANYFTKDFEGRQARTARETLLDLGDFKNLEQAAEVITVIPFAKVGGAIKTLSKAGSPKDAVALTTSAVKEGQTVGLNQAAKNHGLDPEEVVEAVLPKAAVNSVQEDLVGASLDSVDALERGEEILREAVSVNARSSLDAPARGRLKESQAAKIKRTFKGRAIKDVEVEYTEFSDGTLVPQAVALVGKQKGDGGFLNKSSAENVLKRYGVQGEAVQDGSGQWFARAKLNVDQSKYLTPVQDIRAAGPVARSILGADSLGSKGAQQQALIADRVDSATRKTFKDLGNRNYNRLNRKSRGLIDTIIEEATDAEAPWFNPDQLKSLWKERTGKPISDRALNSYYDIKDAMNLHFFINNDNAVKRLTQEGAEHVALPHNLGEGNAIVRRSPQSGVPSARAYDVTQGSHKAADLGSALTEDSWKALKAQGYIRVSLKDAVELPDGTFIREFIGKAEDFSVGPIKRVQTHYKPGVHRHYTDKWFSKAAATVKQKDTGKAAFATPKAYRTFASKAQADEWNATMNAARQVLLRNPEDLTGLARIFDGQGNYPSPEEFIESVRKGEVNIEEAFETVRDGALPSKLEGDFETERLFASEGQAGSANSLEFLGKTQGRAFTSPRGGRLKGFDGKEANVLSVRDSLNAAATQASRLRGFGEYVTGEHQKLLKAFSEHIDTSKSPVSGSVLSLVDNAVLKSGTDDAVARQFITQRQLLQRQRNLPSKFELAAKEYNDRIQDLVVDHLPKGVEIARFLENQNPLNALRGMAFHLGLGLLNIKQAFVQMSTAFQMGLAFGGGPQGIFQAYGTGFLMTFAGEYGPRAAGILKQNPKLLQVLGFEADEAAKVMETYAASGWSNISGSHQLMNYNSAVVGRVSGELGYAWGKIKEGSTFFFTTPEKFNRGTAYALAWRKTKKQFGTVDPRNPDHMASLNGFVGDFSAQMTSASQSAWQKGPASVATQFWSYPWRMFELMTPGFSKTFTGKDRARLIGSSLALFGTGGHIVSSQIADTIKEKTGETPKKGDLAYYVDRGLMDSSVNLMLGGDSDIDFASSVATGNFLPDLIDQVINQSTYGDKSLLDLTGGAGLDRAVDVTGSFIGLGKTIAAGRGEFDPVLTKQAVIDVARNVTSFNNAYKSYLAFKYDTYYSRHGQQLDTEITNPEALAVAFGFGPSSANDAFVSKKYLEDNQTIVQDLSGQIEQLIRQAQQDPENYDKYMRSIDFLAKIHEDDLHIWDSAYSSAVNKAGVKEGFVQETQKRLENEQLRKQQSATITEVFKEREENNQ